MKPAPVEYEAPRSVEAALDLLAEHGFDAKLLAGGQSLVPILNFRLAQPALLIDLNRVEELAGVRVANGSHAGGTLRIAAMTRQRRLESDPRVAAAAPLLREMVPFIAHPQIRNRGTVGGSLAHADPAAELPAAAVALRARFKLLRRGGERWIEAKDFYVGLLTTALEPEELLAEIEVPAAPPGTGWAFTEFARRHGDYALAGVAAGVTLDPGGVCREARLVFMSLGDVPMEAAEAAGRLVGEKLTEEAIAAAAANAARDEIDPSGDIHASADYKRHLAEVLTRRVLRRAAERAREGAGSR